jgi:hypothetical protein
VDRSAPLKLVGCSEVDRALGESAKEQCMNLAELNRALGKNGGTRTQEEESVCDKFVCDRKGRRGRRVEQKAGHVFMDVEKSGDVGTYT